VAPRRILRSAAFLSLRSKIRYHGYLRSQSPIREREILQQIEFRIGSLSSDRISLFSLLSFRHTRDDNASRNPSCISIADIAHFGRKLSMYRGLRESPHFIATFRFDRRLSVYRSKKAQRVSSMKMISWYPSINRLHLPASRELQADACRPASR